MTSGERNWSSTTGAILMVSLMICSTWMQVIDNEKTLDEAPVTRLISASDTLSYDAQTNSSQPSSNYGSAENILISGSSDYTLARMLININLTLGNGGVIPATAVVSEASLELQCQKMSTWPSELGTDTILYPAKLLTGFDESNATYNESDSGTSWGVSGADGVGIDREHWEPGDFVAAASSQYQIFNLNLTSLVQDALRAGESNMSIVVSSAGMPMVCASSEHRYSARHPSIDFEYTLSSTPAQGSVVIEGPQDGEVVADSSELLIAPDYSPTITWDNLTSSHLEIQFSSGPDFRSVEDETRLWNSWTHSSDFSIPNEEFTTPENDADLVNGTWVYFRMRSVNNSIIGPWDTGYFGLAPELGSLNAQGQAEVSLRNESLNLFGILHDTWVMDGNTSYNGNDDLRMRIGHSNNTSEGNMHAFLRLNIGQVPLHENITIHDATLNLRRTDRTGEPMISVVKMDGSGHEFSELNYTHKRNGVTWSNGGLGDELENSGAILGTVNGNQTGTALLSYDATSFVQEYLRLGHGGDLDFIVIGRGLAGEEVEIATGNEPPSYRPHLSLTYSWGDSTPTASSSLIAPLRGSAAWDMNSWELESTTTPTLEWDPSVVSNTNGNPADVIIQLFPDGVAESIPFTVDSREDNGFDLTNGEFTIPSSWDLDWGQTYDWRMVMIEDGEQGPWRPYTFLVSEINSTSLGNGEHELRYRHGNGTSQTGNELPHCSDLTLEGGAASGMNLDGQDLTVSTSQVVLLSCDLSTHAMPDGLAIVSATMRVRTLQQSGIGSFAIPMTMYESSEHYWEESSATWNTTDGSTPWNAPGASGNERVQTLDTVDISASNTWYEWNVTAAAQSAMRTDSQLDFILTSSSWNAVSFYDKGSGSMPELVIVYTNGSNAAPNVPINLIPTNGDWILSGDYTFGVDQTPTLAWNETGVTAANGWQVQVDESSSFTSSALLTFASWIDTSEFSGSSFTFSSNLTAGETFYWRVRGISATGQIGLWTAGSSFVVPDIDVTENQLLNTTYYTVEMAHGSVLSDGSLPIFKDTWISWNQNHQNDTHASDDTLFVSGTSSALIEIPISGSGALPIPSNARLVGAVIDFQVLTNNSSTPNIGLFEVLQDWNESATGLTYDGVNNWSSIGAQGPADRNDWSDISYDQSDSTRMSLGFTDIAQAAIDRGDSSVKLMISAEMNSNDQIVLASTETQFESNLPKIHLSWMNGTGAVPSESVTLQYPANNEIIWEHPVLTAETAPEFNWSATNNSNVDGWIICYVRNGNIWDWSGCSDSYGTPSYFDLQNLTYTVPGLFDLNHDTSWSWFVSPISNWMIGTRSAQESFRIPNDIGDSINATDHWVDLTNSNAYSATGAYDVAQGAYIDSCNPNSAYGASSSHLSVGLSNGGPSCSNAGHESRSLLRFDISNVPIMDGDAWQVIEAHIDLYRVGGSSSYDTDVSISSVNCNWIEGTVTWNQCWTNNTWQSPGAYGANDADVPAVSTNVSGNGWYSWNVTQLMQQAHLGGSDILSMLLASEDINLNARHSFINEDATGACESFRPILTISYRAGNQTMPTAPTWDSNLTANGPFTAWDENSLRPMPTDPLWATWNHPSASTIDSWQVQVSLSERFTTGAWMLDSNDVSTWGNSTFDLVNQTLWTPARDAQGDHWNHLRIRAVQDGVYSNWSNMFQSRVPEEQGSDDGAGNFSVTMQRGAVFEDTGLLPSMPDSYVTSNTFGQTTNFGSATSIAVGLDPADSAHDAVGLLSIDLGEYPYPTTMLPTSVTLRMYVSGIAGNGAHSIAIHECGGFIESNVTWNNYNPNTQCNGTSASSMTSTSTNSGVWYEWDVTNIARNAWSSSGVMNMGLQTGWAGTVYFNSADGSSDYAPELVVDYVDNPSNASSPAQVTLLSPDHLEVIYDVGQYTLGSAATRPSLTWDTLSDATGYILILSNATDTLTYESWDPSGNSGFTIGTSPTPTTWSPDFDLAVGEIYTWSVQALNGSVPGPRSIPSTFGIGNPTITDVGNLVYTVEIQEGSDVPALGHLPIWDTYLNEGDANAGHGTQSTLHIGTGCESVAANRCHAVYQIDMGQMPLDQLPVNPHSAQLSIYADQISQLSLANYLDLTAYAVINPNYDEAGATWNAASTGFNWSASGMQAGIDYIATPLDTVRVMSTFTGGWLHFDVSGAMTTMNGTVTVVIMGSTNAGHMLIDIKSSESPSSDKPKLLFNYTSVDSISLSGPSTTDADTGVPFSGSLLDASGNTLVGDVIWSCTDGSIDASGFFTPDQTGVVTISAAYGQVIESVNITVTAGSPIQLVIIPLAITMTADDTFTLSQIKVIDSNGNEVPGETIHLEISNGTLSTGMTLTTPITTDVTWTPWTAGQQYLNATWSFQPTISVPITVNVGAPNYFEIVATSQIEAGNTTGFTVDVFDQRGNQMDSSLSGTLTWGAENGAMDNATGSFTGDQIGNWNVWVDSDLGISSSTSIEVTYGDIAELEVTATGPTNVILVTSSPTLESIYLTADDNVSFAVVRIDVQGNRESVDLPITGWTWLNGQFEAGPPSIWDAANQGSSWVKASLEGFDVVIPMSVEHGLPVEIDARPENNDPANLILISSGSMGSVDAYVADEDGNEWTVSAIWTTSDSNADSWLTPQGPTAIFEPVLVGDWTVNVRYEFNVPGIGTQQVTNSVTFTVLPGQLHSITTSNDATITADDNYDLNPDARDAHGND
ncbi:MAG: DNRLRE domain-containing protein, partial [Candidatus Thermoplasmatota archaeon]|nr:DNRLRE domain-containing protein [Candidatus Thermoplasmatota archaeon]